MSKFEGKIETSDAVPVDAGEILANITAQSDGPPARTDAVVRYLALGEGWKEASLSLRGAFAARDDG